MRETGPAGRARRGRGGTARRGQVRAQRAAGVAVVALSGVLAAGCGSVSARPVAPDQAAPAALSLSTSAEAAGATWVTVPMGATSGADLFWELFALPAGGRQWSLQTPPDIATNGAIVLAAPSAGGTAARTLVAGVRPSLDLGFSPITSTSDLGQSWATSPPQSGLADVPDALATAPDGHLIALGQDGEVSVTPAAGRSWSTLTSQRALATVARGCGLTGLTGVAYSPAGTPLVTGTCSRDGTVAVLAGAGGTWHQVSPVLPASLAGQPARILRLSRTGQDDVALLETGRAPSVRLLAAWTSDAGQQWTLSRVLQAGRAALSASFGAGGLGVVLAGHRAETLAGPGSSWRPLPVLPAGRTVTLALPSGGTEALAAGASTLTAWRLTGAPARWVQAQSVKVPIQYGSSS